MKDTWLGILLGAVGVAIVGLAALGLAPTPIALTLWTLAGIGWVAGAHRFATKPWLTVAIAGVASGLWAGGTQAIFLPALVANDAAWASFGTDMPARFEAFASALPIGIVWGILFAAVAWFVGRLQQRRQPAMAQ